MLGRLELSGLVAWLGWLFVHLLFLVGFRNRLVVLFEWAWAYATYQRSSRIIVSPEDYAPAADSTVVPLPTAGEASTKRAETVG